MTAKKTFNVLSIGDMDRALSFWRDTLGCVERFTTPGFSEVLAGDDVIALQASGTPAGGSDTSLGIDVDDIAATCTAIASGGGAVHTTPHELVPGVQLAIAEDPDGNRFRITQH